MCWSLLLAEAAFPWNWSPQPLDRLLLILPGATGVFDPTSTAVAAVVVPILPEASAIARAEPLSRTGPAWCSWAGGQVVEPSPRRRDGDCGLLLGLVIVGEVGDAGRGEDVGMAAVRDSDYVCIYGF